MKQRAYSELCSSALSLKSRRIFVQDTLSIQKSRFVLQLEISGTIGTSIRHLLKTVWYFVGNQSGAERKFL